MNSIMIAKGKAVSVGDSIYIFVRETPIPGKLTSFDQDSAYVSASGASHKVSFEEIFSDKKDALAWKRDGIMRKQRELQDELERVEREIGQ